MNIPPGEGEAHLQAFNHLNRAQRRCFILSDQLQTLDAHHLDTFIDGVGNPEPPLYKRTEKGVHPPLMQVAIKESAGRFDLGNIEFQEGASTHLRRIHLACVDGCFEVKDEDPLTDPNDIDSFPINWYLAKEMLPSYKAKYEAIDERVQYINEMRKKMYEQELKKDPKTPKTPSRFKDGKSVAKYMESANNFAASAEVSRKRPGEAVVRHPLNKKKRIGIDHVSNNIKTESVNRLSDQTKIDIFNAFIKSAFPDLDNLLMASWNVVSVYVSIGSKDMTLHQSISDLHDVLMKFDEKVGKSKKAQRPDVNAGADPQNGSRNGSVRMVSAAPDGHRPSYDRGASQIRDQDRLVELLPNLGDDVEMDESPSSSTQEEQKGSEAHPSNDRHSPEDHPKTGPRQHRPNLDQQSVQTPVRGPDTSGQSTTKSGPRRLPQSHADLFTHKSGKDVRRRSIDAESIIDKGYTAIHAPQTPPSSTQPPVDKPKSTPKSLQKSTPTRSDPRRPEPSRLAAEAAEIRNREKQQQSQSQSQLQTAHPPQSVLALPPKSSQKKKQNKQKSYGMFSGLQHHQSSADSSIDALFVGSDEDEAVETPAMQEVVAQEREAEQREREKKPVFLGNSILGPPKKAGGSTGSAPVAPMMHNSLGKKGAGEGTGN